MRSTYFIGAWLDRHDLQSYFNRENCFWSTVREFKNRRGLKAFTAKATCPCGNEFHQKSKVDIYCCITCRKKYTGSSVKKVHLSPEQIEEVKSEIRSAKRGHGRLIADKWGIPVSQVWKLAGQIRLEKREEEFETPDNPYSAAGQ
jgi:ribosomal protein L37AE/L43A